jgi:hypothetical protein
MRLPRFRLRTLMIAVVVVALLLSGPLQWAIWLNEPCGVPVEWELEPVFRPQSLTCTSPAWFKYKFSLREPYPPLFMPVRIKTTLWVWDEAGPTMVDRHTFYRTAISGVRNEVAGTINPPIGKRGAGRYEVQFFAEWSKPFTSWQPWVSCARSYVVRSPVGDNLRTRK